LATSIDPRVKEVLDRGIVIPASPLALTAERRLDERRQRALWRYYVAAGSGGLAIGVHTTQFAIRDPKIGLFEPVLKLAAEEMDRADANRAEPLVRIAGICGRTEQAASEASLVRSLGYHAGLLSLAAMKDASEDELIAHCRTSPRSSHSWDSTSSRRSEAECSPTLSGAGSRRSRTSSP
jgi:dihydrodipicolinate synthase/N-acetylneuraminate lyase